MAMIYSNDAWLVNGSTWPLWISHLLWPMEGSHLADSNFACLICSLVLFWRSTLEFVNHEHSISSIISLSWHWIMYEHCCLCPASLLAPSYLRVNPLVDAMVEGWQLANACFFVRELNAGVLQTFKFGVERGGSWQGLREAIRAMEANKIKAWHFFGSSLTSIIML